MDQNSTYYLNKVKTIIKYSFDIILIIGLVGNLFAFLVFSSLKFKNTIFATYFRFLCFFDSLFAMIMFIIDILLYLNINFETLSNTCCKIKIYFTYVVAATSVWTMAIISLDRMFSIVWSNRFQFRKKTINQIIIIVGIIIYNILYWSPDIFLFSIENIHNNQSNQTVLVKCQPSLNFLKYFSLANTTILPFFIMILSTILTLIKVFRSRRRQSNQHSSSIKNKDVKFAITSISLNLLFLFFNLPITIFAFFIDYSNEVEKFITTILTLLFQCNYFILFFVNFIVNNSFRQEFFNMMKRFKVKIQTFFSN